MAASHFGCRDLDRHRRPQPAVHRRPDRGGHGHRADRAIASPRSAGRHSASTATTSTPSSTRCGKLAPAGTGQAAADRGRHRQGPRREAHGTVAAMARRQPRRPGLRRRPRRNSTPACNRASPEKKRGKAALSGESRGHARPGRDLPRHRRRRCQLADCKDARSVRRHAERAPSRRSSLGEELADIADDDRAHRGAHRRSRQRQPHHGLRRAPPGPLLQPRHRREEHDDHRRRHGVVRHGRLCGDLRLLLRASWAAEQIQHRLRLSRHAGAGDRPPLRHVDGLLRHQPPRAGGPRDHAHHRRPDGGLRDRRQSAARRPARLGRPSRRHVYPPRPRPRS